MIYVYHLQCIVSGGEILFQITVILFDSLFITLPVFLIAIPAAVGATHVILVTVIRFTVRLLLCIYSYSGNNQKDSFDHKHVNICCYPASSIEGTCGVDTLALAFSQ